MKDSAAIPARDCWRALLATPAEPLLGPERRDGTKSLAELDAAMALAEKTSPLPAETRDIAQGLIYLWHDHLDAAHQIAQDTDSSDGSLLHAIMHRREPDFWNSKYWFRRAGKHPSFAVLARRAAAQFSEEEKRGVVVPFLGSGQWDPCAFVDACERAAKDSSPQETAVLRRVQKIEFEAFLDWLLD